MSGSMEIGMTALERCVEHKPTDSVAHLALGVLKASEGDRDGAEIASQRAYQLDPSLHDLVVPYLPSLQSAQLLVEAAEEYLRKDAIPEACGFYAAAINLDPLCVEAYKGYASTLIIHFGPIKMHTAVELFRKVVELRPDDTAAHHNLGVGLKVLGRLEEARGSFQRAIDLNGDNLELKMRSIGLHNSLSSGGSQVQVL